MASIVIDLMNAGKDISARGGVCAVWQDNYNKHYHLGKYSQQEITPETTTPAHAPDDEPAALYLDAEDLFSDHAGDNSAPLQDIPLDVPEIMPDFSHDTPAENTTRRVLKFVVGVKYIIYDEIKGDKYTALITARTEDTVSYKCLEKNTAIITAPVFMECAFPDEWFNAEGLGFCCAANDIPECPNLDEILAAIHAKNLHEPAPVIEPEISLPETATTLHAQSYHEPITINAEFRDITPPLPAQPDSTHTPVIDHAPAHFITAASTLIHSVAWRRSLLWGFAILWVFCLRNLNRNEAQNFHRPLPSHKLILTETRGLQGEALHLAVADNSMATLNAPDRDSLADGLAHLSGQAVKKIGRLLGLLTPMEKGSGGFLGGVLADRLFAHKTTQADISSQVQRAQLNTYTDCKRQIVIIFD